MVTLLNGWHLTLPILCNSAHATKVRSHVLYKYIYLITSILRNIASQLQCISVSAAGTSAIPVTDEQYFSVAM